MSREPRIRRRAPRPLLAPRRGVGRPQLPAGQGRSLLARRVGPLRATGLPTAAVHRQLVRKIVLYRTDALLYYVFVGWGLLKRFQLVLRQSVRHRPPALRPSPRQRIGNAATGAAFDLRVAGTHLETIAAAAGCAGNPPVVAAPAQLLAVAANAVRVVRAAAGTTPPTQSRSRLVSHSGLFSHAGTIRMAQGKSTERKGANGR